VGRASVAGSTLSTSNVIIILPPQSITKA